MNQYPCLRHLPVQLSLLSVMEKNSQVLIGTEPEPIQLDEFERDSDSDYDETESEEIVDLLLVDEIMRAGMSSLKG